MPRWSTRSDEGCRWAAATNYPAAILRRTDIPSRACTRMYHQNHCIHYMNYSSSTTVCTAASRYPGKWRCGGGLHVVRCTVPAMDNKRHVCMACPSRRVQRAPGAYPTRCVGVRGRRVRALKQQRVCVRRRSVAHLGACTLDRPRLVSFFSPNYALGVRKGHPYGKDWQ
jgi:hypothetical protein